MYGLLKILQPDQITPQSIRAIGTSGMELLFKCNYCYCYCDGTNIYSAAVAV